MVPPALQPRFHLEVKMGHIWGEGPLSHWHPIISHWSRVFLSAHSKVERMSERCQGCVLWRTWERRDIEVSSSRHHDCSYFLIFPTNTGRGRWECVGPPACGRFRTRNTWAPRQSNQSIATSVAPVPAAAAIFIALLCFIDQWIFFSSFALFLLLLFVSSSLPPCLWRHLDMNSLWTFEPDCAMTKILSFRFCAKVLYKNTSTKRKFRKLGVKIYSQQSI